MDDAMFDVLADDQRRRLLYNLLESNPQQVPNVANGPQTRPENGDTVVQNHHVHLPKLDDHGYVEWEPESGTVTRGPCFEEIEPLLAFLSTRE